MSDVRGLQEALGKLLEVSYKGYAKEQADILTALDTLVSNSGSFTDERQFEQALNMMDQNMGKVRGSANKMVAEAYHSALEDQALSFISDKQIQSSIGQSEMEMRNLMQQYQTSEMEDILNSLKQTAEKYRGVASEGTMAKLNEQIVRAHEIANLAEDFAKYDSEATKFHEGPSDYMSGRDEEVDTRFGPSMTKGAKGKDESFYTGQGIQLPDNPTFSKMASAYNKLARLDLKGAQKEFDEAEKVVVNESWADAGRALGSSISRTNQTLKDFYGSDKADEWVPIPSDGMASLNVALIDKTRDHAINTLADFIESNDGIKEGEGNLGRAYKANGAMGVVDEVQAEIEARASQDPDFAKKSITEQIKIVGEGVNWEDAIMPWKWGAGEAGPTRAFASILETLIELDNVVYNLDQTLNVDIFHGR